MGSIDKLKGGRHEIITKKYQERLVDGGKICTMCKKVKKHEDYNKRMGGTQSFCKTCASDINKKRYHKNKYKLW